MKILPIILFAVLVLAANPASAASTPAKPKTPPPATNAPPAQPAPPPAPTPAPVPGLTLDDYIKELTAAANLSDTEKGQIEDLYVADGPVLKTILNNDALSPYQQAQQVSDLRDVRNAKIVALLLEVDRTHAFLLVEAKYRVGLTLLAADGGWVPSAPPAK
jgi:hypothetical protein